MSLLPFKNITYQTSLTEEEIYTQLSNNTFHVVKSNIVTMYLKSIFNSSSNKYLGLVNYNSFKLIRTSGYNYKMVFIGSYQKEKGDVILIKVSYHRWLATLFTIFANIFLGSFFYTIFQNGDFTPWLIMGFLLAIVVINIVSYRLFQYEISIFEKFLEKTISATRVKKENAS